MIPSLQGSGKAVAAALTNYVTYSCWTLANKYQFLAPEKGGYGVTTAVLATAFQMLVAGLLSYIVIFWLKFQRNPSSELFSWRVLRTRILPLGIARGIDIGCGNFALLLVAVSVQQVVKSLLPVFVSLLSVTLLRKRVSQEVWMTLIPIILGCVLATVSKVEVNSLGLMLAVISCVARAFKAVLNARLLHGENNLKPLEILLLEAPTTGFLLMVPGLLTEGSVFFASLANIGGPFAGLAYPLLWYNVGCGVLMFFNQASYITIIEQTSALTCQILMNLKMLMLILLSVRIFHTQLSGINIIGIVLATAGVFAYAHVSTSTKERQAAKRELASEKAIV